MKLIDFNQFPRFLIWVLLSLATFIPLVASSFELVTIYDVFSSYGLPTGLLPKGVNEFKIDVSGMFQVHLDQACNAKFESELHYERNVTGKLSYGRVSDLSGVQAQDLFLWFPVNSIHVDVPSSGLIYFDVSVVKKQFSLSLFETPPDCVAVVSPEMQKASDFEVWRRAMKKYDWRPSLNPHVVHHPLTLTFLYRTKTRMQKIQNGKWYHLRQDYFMVRRHVPAFGSWASGEYLPFTECFESARKDGLLPYSYHENDLNIGRADFCVTGDLYQNDVVTPAMIVFPRNRSKSMRPVGDVKQTKLKKADKWEPGHPSYTHRRNVHQPMIGSPRRFTKPVDEDLYKISPDQLQKSTKKKRGLGFFASCCFAST